MPLAARSVECSLTSAATNDGGFHPSSLLLSVTFEKKKEKEEEEKERETYKDIIYILVVGDV